MTKGFLWVIFAGKCFNAMRSVRSVVIQVWNGLGFTTVGTLISGLVSKEERDWFLYGVLGYVKKGDIIETGGGDTYIVTKVYKFNLWRRILEWLGKPFEYHNCVKIRRYERH